MTGAHRGAPARRGRGPAQGRLAPRGVRKGTNGVSTNGVTAFFCF